MAKEHEVTIACPYCDETGVLPPVAGVAKLCVGCRGSGYRTLTYKIFTRRKKRAGVKTVVRSGAGILSVKPKGITYASFTKGRVP